MRSTGNRNRTAVDTAISVYEEAMSRRLRVDRTLECAEIRRRLERAGDFCAANKADKISKIRNNSRHFAGLRFGRDIAIQDLTIIEGTLLQFGEQRGAEEVRRIRNQIQNGNSSSSRRPKEVKRRSPHQSRRSYAEHLALSTRWWITGGGLVTAGLVLVGATSLDTVGAFVFLGGLVALAIGFATKK